MLASLRNGYVMALTFAVDLHGRSGHLMFRPKHKQPTQVLVDQLLGYCMVQ